MATQTDQRLPLTDNIVGISVPPDTDCPATSKRIALMLPQPAVPLSSNSSAPSPVPFKKRALSARIHHASCMPEPFIRLRCVVSCPMKLPRTIQKTVPLPATQITCGNHDDALRVCDSGTSPPKQPLMVDTFRTQAFFRRQAPQHAYKRQRKERKKQPGRTGSDRTCKALHPASDGRQPAETAVLPFGRRTGSGLQHHPFRKRRAAKSTRPCPLRLPVNTAP